MRILVAVAVACAVSITPAPAQRPETQERPAADISSLAWLAGSWRGTGLGGTVTETWDAPVAGRMLGHFLFVKDGAPVFSELLQIVPEGGGLVYQVRHFGPDLRGWEDKTGQAERFILRTAGKGVVRFDGLTYRQTGPDTMEAIVRIDSPDGAKDERFVFQRMRP